MEITESEFDILTQCLFDCTEELNYLREPPWEWESHSYLVKQKIKRRWPKRIVKEAYERNRKLIMKLDYARRSNVINIVKDKE